MATEPITAPSKPGEWSLTQIEQALSRPLPNSMLKTKTIKGNEITYIPWHYVNRVLSKYAPGFTWEIIRMEFTDSRIFLIGRLTIPTSEGNVYREASGSELLKEIDKNGQPKEIPYGDPIVNSESQAFRRCAARFGLGLSLYDAK
jgi:hypothetical protein